MNEFDSEPYFCFENSFSPSHWARQVTEREKISLDERGSYSIHSIVERFKQHLDKRDSLINDETTVYLAGRIKQFSEERKKYYSSGLIGRIIEFFSALRNALTLWIPTSSGQLGYDLADKFLNDHEQTQKAIREIKKEVSKGESTEKKHSNSRQRSTIGATTPLKSQISKSPKESMTDTFENIWKHVSPDDMKYIEDLYSKIIKRANVKQWSEVGHQEYTLELEQEMSGTSPVGFGFNGMIKMKNKMNIKFSEEQIEGSDRYRQVISFPNQGVEGQSKRFGILSFVVNRIVIEHDDRLAPQCTIETTSGSYFMHADAACKDLNGITWTT